MRSGYLRSWIGDLQTGLSCAIKKDLKKDNGIVKKKVVVTKTAEGREVKKVSVPLAVQVIVCHASSQHFGGMRAAWVQLRSGGKTMRSSGHYPKGFGDFVAGNYADTALSSNQHESL